MPDAGFVGLAELAVTVSSIRGVVDLPLVVDADTGFGNAVSVGRTVRVLERCGADAILYANAALRAALKEARNVLECLHREGSTERVLDQLVSWEDRQALVGKCPAPRSRVQPAGGEVRGGGGC